MTPSEKRSWQDCGGIFAQVQVSVRILSPVPISDKCYEKDYEHLFIHDSGVKICEGKIAYVRSGYHEHIMCITRVIGYGRPMLFAHIDHVLMHHLNQYEDVTKNLYA